ncbi:MAG TPA: hypothetical protein VKQ72_15550 [Aggregatilineales bacterium]|nr:hypothetical protein [Aggregatilineales bacterium]
MAKNPKAGVYEISVQMRVLDKTIIPQIVVDRVPALLIAHVSVLPAGEARKGAKRWFAFQSQRGLPTTDAPYYGWVGESDWTVPQEDYELVGWLPLDSLPAKKQTEFKKSEWGLVAVVLADNKLRLRDVQLDVSMPDEAHERMRQTLGIPEVVFMPDLERQILVNILEKREVYQVYL